MPFARRRYAPAVLCLSLLFAGGQALAAESRHMGANGGGACPDSSTTAGNEQSDDSDSTSASPAQPRRTQKAKASSAPRSSGNRAPAPRWHSFLPGMFR